MIKYFAIIFLLILPLVNSAILQNQLTIEEGQLIDIGIQEIIPNFGMITGKINFKLGNFSWPPKTIWLLPKEISPDSFSKELKPVEFLEIPQNLTFSTCRTAVYFNPNIGYGFKIYNTKTLKQILDDGNFCGLAYDGTYFVYVSY